MHALCINIGSIGPTVGQLHYLFSLSGGRLNAIYPNSVHNNYKRSYSVNDFNLTARPSNDYHEKQTEYRLTRDKFEMLFRCI